MRFLRLIILGIAVLAAAPAAMAWQASGSSTMPDGSTVSVESQPDGSRVKTVTDRDGNVTSRETVDDAPTKVPPKEKGTSGSTKDADGNTVTYKKNPDGTTTKTVTSPNGQELDSEVMQPEPVTKPTPREGGDSASTTDEHGNTVTIQIQPDGTKVKIVTSPDGVELDREPVTEPPPTIAGDRMVYDEVKKGPVTATVGIVGRRVGQQVLLEVSIIALGPKGPNARTWEVDSIVLDTPNGKRKPVTSEAFYVAKEGTGPNTIAQAVFTAIGNQYAHEAPRAKASEGEVCPVTGEKTGQREDKGRFAKEIERQGMAGTMALLTSQARGEVTGRKATFDVTDLARVPGLKDLPILGRLFNARHDARPNPSEPREVTLTIFVSPSILRGNE